MPRRSKQPRVQVDIKLIGQLATYNGARLKYSFTVPPTVSIGHVLAMLRKTIKINKHEALFVFVKNSEGHDVIAPMNSLCSSLAIGGKINLKVSVESAFGAGEPRTPRAWVVWSHALGAGLPALPLDIINIIRDFLMIGRQEVLSNMSYVHSSICLFGELKLPGDSYRIRDVIEFVNYYPFKGGGTPMLRYWSAGVGVGFPH